jgi:hypothetical protein
MSTLVPAIMWSAFEWTALLVMMLGGWTNPFGIRWLRSL